MVFVVLLLGLRVFLGSDNIKPRASCKVLGFSLPHAIDGPVYVTKNVIIYLMGGGY